MVVVVVVEEKSRRESRERRGPRGDRHWRRSNNGLLAMIIEHEAAGTLLKSTENRAGGFTCRINFYLVSSLLLFFAHSSVPFLSTLLTATGFPGHRLFFPSLPPSLSSSVFLPRRWKPVLHLVVCVSAIALCERARVNERINEHERKSSSVRFSFDIALYI